MERAELLSVFREYAESTSNQGAAYLPTDPADIATLEGDIERAWAAIERAEREGIG
jgi:hypothetical protein